MQWARDGGRAGTADPASRADDERQRADRDNRDDKHRRPAGEHVHVREPPWREKAAPGLSSRGRAVRIAGWVPEGRSSGPSSRNAATDLAARAGVDAGYVRRLMDLGFLKADAPATAGVVRVVRMIDSLERAGISVDAMARAQADGVLSFAFLELPVFDRFSGLSPLTFSDLAAETGIPLDLLMVIREAVGFAQPSPDDLVRDDELTGGAGRAYAFRARAEPRRDRTLVAGLW